MEKFTPEALVERTGGIRTTSRRSGEVAGDGRSVSLETIRTGLRGMRVWSPETRRRLAAAWSVRPEQVLWDEGRRDAVGDADPKVGGWPSSGVRRLAEEHGVVLSERGKALEHRDEFEQRLRGLDPEIANTIEREIDRRVAVRLRQMVDALTG